MQASLFLKLIIATRKENDFQPNVLVQAISGHVRLRISTQMLFFVWANVVSSDAESVCIWNFSLPGRGYILLSLRMLL